MQPNFSLLIEELGDSPITGTTYLSSSTGYDETTISFSSVGTKYIYSVYDGIDTNSVQINVLYCTATTNFNKLYESVYKFLSMTITIQKDNLICQTCQGTIELFSLPSTVLNGFSSTTLASTITNGIATFSQFSILYNGLYDFYIRSNFFENEIKIASAQFYKAKLIVSILQNPTHLDSVFTVNAIFKSYNYEVVLSDYSNFITIKLSPSAKFVQDIESFTQA
ncbi:hypothetical protein SteCoe_40037 [Stentor coeruleus]|uniref:Uncharacterized protein n=1 Tax=Stentor coeruleus TaxID=5963 RepID=A0A1R2AKE1_9CILI|nr:hypothetical protein SteCoe_40037 [Stentor coeruleus]